VPTAVKKPYHKRTDLEKIRTQWHKLTGLHGEEQWSAAVVRAATAAELAANFAIRKEFESTGLSSEFVDSLLLWANGLGGKFNRLLLPLVEGSKEKVATFKQLTRLVHNLNRERNAIVHSGQFRNETDATAIIAEARKLIESMVKMYGEDFTPAWPPPDFSDLPDEKM
jgi:hypothetical protein